MLVQQCSEEHKAWVNFLEATPNSWNNVKKKKKKKKEALMKIRLGENDYNLSFTRISYWSIVNQKTLDQRKLLILIVAK